MKIYILLLMLLVTIPHSYASTEMEAIKAADSFVLQSGKFYHKLSMVEDTRIFRRLYSEDEQEISFMYLALKKIDNEFKKARFIVTVNKKDLSISSLKVEKQKKPQEKFAVDL